MVFFYLEVNPRVVGKIKVEEMSPVQLGQIGGMLQDSAGAIEAVTDD